MMKKLIIFFVFICCNLSYSFSQRPGYQFNLDSRFVKSAGYNIDVLLPVGYDSTRRYPVVYCVDNWLGSKFIPGTLYLLNFSQVLEPIIVVGIGNNGNINSWQMERTRDLTPSHVAEADMSSEHIPGTGGVTGGAENFLSFIKYELIPVVEKKFLSDTLDRGFFGYSYGGLFGAYILINDPQLFQKYLLGSPSMSYDDFLLLKKFKSISTDKLTGVTDIFLTVGEEENADQLNGFAGFRDSILEKGVKNLKLTSLIIEKEGHRSAILSTYYKGFKYLYPIKQSIK